MQHSLLHQHVGREEITGGRKAGTCDFNTQLEQFLCLVLVVVSPAYHAPDNGGFSCHVLSCGSVT